MYFNVFNPSFKVLFDFPNFLSSKIIGTSVALKPNFLAL
jgi:hypothetical protein